MEIIQYIFGTVLITSLAGFLAFIGNLFSLKDRYVNWKKEKTKALYTKKYIEENPDFKFNLGLVSNSEPGKCILSITLINKSKEIKFVDPISYNYEFQNNPNLFLPSTIIMNREKWPKRLEHGERIALSVEIQMVLINNIFDFWQNDVIVYASCRSTTG